MLIVRWRYENDDEDRLRTEAFDTKAQAHRWIKVQCKPIQGDTRVLIVDASTGIKVPAACKAATGSPSRHHATKRKSPAQLDREIAAFLQGHPSTMTHAIPDRGYMVALHGGKYLSSFGSKEEAVRFARGLAKQTRETYDIVKVQNRGEDRFIVDEVAPPATTSRHSSHAAKKSTSEGTLLKYGKFGLSEDPRGLHVMMTWKGRKLLGTVRDVRRDDITGSTHLIVRHFNGEPWPVEPVASAVRVI